MNIRVVKDRTPMMMYELWVSPENAKNTTISQLQHVVAICQ